MRVAITGCKGQLGLALQEAFRGSPTLLMDLPDYDITNLGQTVEAVVAFSPDVILHTAAMTDVEGCERTPELAFHVNVVGTRNVAVAAASAGAAVVYISTDYVFAGRPDRAYDEYDMPDPQSVYARTKFYGEQVVRDHLTRFYIARIAWLYGDGPRNFVKTVLRLADERPSLQMVTDENGSPTYALDVATALRRLVEHPAYGIYHLTNEGVCSRYEWAAEILRLSGRSHVPLEASAGFKRLARVPGRVELRNTMARQLGIVMRPWKDALQDYMARLVHG